MPKEIIVQCVDDFEYRIDGNNIQTWDFDYNDKVLRIDFKDGCFVEFYKQNIICVEYKK